MTPTPPRHDPARTPTHAAAERAARREAQQGMSVEEIARAMPAGELERNVRKGGTAAIAESERRQAEAAEDAAPPHWMQERRGEIGNYDPER